MQMIVSVFVFFAVKDSFIFLFVRGFSIFCEAVVFHHLLACAAKHLQLSSADSNGKEHEEEKEGDHFVAPLIPGIPRKLTW